MKKYIIGTLALTALLLPLAGGVLAAEESVKPWETLSRFSNGVKESRAQNMDMDKEDFQLWRNEAREEQRAFRLQAREERLKEAVSRGCLSEEEVSERLGMRRGRFAN